MWSAQLDSSRTELEQAGNGLAVQFAGIVENLDEVLQASDSALDGEAPGLFETSRRRLDQVVSTLHEALEIKRGTLADLRGLLDPDSEMTTMTGEVRRIAKKAAEIGAAIDAVLEKAQESAEHESVAVSNANGEVQAVLDDLPGLVSGMRRAAQRLGSATSGVQSEVAGSLVDMQLQDRVCQMPAHLRDSVAALASEGSG